MAEYNGGVLVCECTTCSYVKPGLVCYCGGMCMFRTVNINAVRRHKLWPRSFPSNDLLNSLQQCPMATYGEKVKKVADNGKYVHYQVRDAVQTSSLVNERDFHLYFEIYQRLGLGRDESNMKLSGKIQLVETQEVRKRTRVIGDVEYVQILESDKMTFTHDIMTALDEHIFLGSRHLSMQHFDLSNNQWEADRLSLQTCLAFEAFVRLDCEPFCDTAYGYCPACVDAEVIVPDYVKVDVVEVPDNSPVQKVEPSLELPSSSSVNGDIPPSGTVATTPNRFRKCSCPGAPSHHRRPSSLYTTNQKPKKLFSKDGEIHVEDSQAVDSDSST